MTLRPLDFLKTAELLRDNDLEPHQRSSISRSYYAAFLHLLEHIKGGLQIRKTTISSPHEFVKKCLINCSNRSVMTIGHRLDSLRTKRTDADYRLDKPIRKNDVVDAIDEANLIIQRYMLAVAAADVRKKLMDSSRQQAANKGLTI